MGEDGLAIPLDSSGSFKVMKAEYEKVMLGHVRAKLEKAQGLGIKASWTTRDHLNALTDVVMTCGGEREKVLDALEECYNVSAFQQKLAKTFKESGHFQRDGRKSVSEEADELVKLAQGLV